MPDQKAIAEEIHRITHEVRGALSILQVGAQMFGRSQMEGSHLADAMESKISQVNTYCDQLNSLSESLKKTT